MDVLHHTDSYSHFHSKNKLDENMFGLVQSWVTLSIRDWSLITGRGGYKTGAGGHVKFYPNEKGGGGGKSFSYAEGRAHKVLG